MGDWGAFLWGRQGCAGCVSVALTKTQNIASLHGWGIAVFFVFLLRFIGREILDGQWVVLFVFLLRFTKTQNVASLHG